MLPWGIIDMPNKPPESLIKLIHNILYRLLKRNPAATSSEAYILNHVEMQIIDAPVVPRYFVRIGINYHGQKVQQLQLNSVGKLVGWNSSGDALGTGRNAKMLLSGFTIFDRDPTEPMMNDTKIGGGDIATDSYIRVEVKARGWLGKTKNLDGKQLEKDIDLIKQDKADLLVLCLSETAHRKWRGEGPQYQSNRRTGISRFLPILVSSDRLASTRILRRTINYEGQTWTVSTQKIKGSSASMMPGAKHFVTICWRN